MNLKSLKKILKEEAEKENLVYSPGNESLDIQVDDYLNGYIGKASATNEATKKLEKSTKELDATKLASDVANLVDNAKNMIEFKNTIIRRTLNRISKEFGVQSARELEITLEDLYGLVIGKSQNDLYDEVDAPLADRAGPLE